MTITDLIQEMYGSMKGVELVSLVSVYGLKDISL